MKRISLLIFAFLLLCLPVFAGQTVRPVITSGTVAAGGVLISAVDGGANPSGGAFIDVDTSKTGAADFSAAILTAVTNNDVVELTSKTNGKKIYAYAKAAGTGETLGETNINPDPGFDSAVGWTTQNGWSVIGGQVVVVAGTGAFFYRSATQTVGALYKTTFDIVAANTSDFKALYRTTPQASITYYGTPGTITEYITLKSGDDSIIGLYRSTPATSTGTFDNLNRYQVLTPSSAGITLTNTAGGSTYNFALKDSAFTYNDSAGYDYRILSSTAYGKLMSSDVKYTSDFSAGVDGWYNINSDGSVSGNIDSIGGQDNNLRYTCGTTSSVQHGFARGSAFTTGKRYTVSFYYYIPSTNSNLNNLILRSAYWGGTDYIYNTLDAWTQVTKTFIANNSLLAINGAQNGNYTFTDSGGDDVFYIRGLTVTELNASKTITSGTLHIATKDGEAMFFHDSIDFSALPYQFVFYDATGKSAQAYAGAVGGGLAYTDIIGGADPTLANGDFSTDEPPGTTWTRYTVWTITGGVAVLNGSDYLRQLPAISAGNLLKWSGDLVSYTSGAGVKFRAGDVLETAYHTAPATYSGYVTASGAASGAYGSGALSIDNYVLQKLTDVPATGLHLMSAKNGTTRNMKSVESGFNPNTITRVNIYRAF